MSARWRKIAANLAVMSASILVCLVVLEFALRKLAFDPNLSYIRPPGWSYLVRTNDLVPFVDGDHLFVANRLGFRGDLPGSGATPKIAVLGGSTVEDWALSVEETWAQQLAQQLRDCAPDIWVANLGKSGANIRHHAPQLDQLLDYMPSFDYIVVLAGLNDFLFDYHIHHSFEPPDNWWNLQAFMYRAGDEGSLATLAIIRRLVKNYQEQKSQPISDLGHYQEYLRNTYKKVTPEQWVDTLPDHPDFLKAYQDNILSIKSIGDAYGAKTVFVNQPFLWSETMSQEAKDQIYAGFIGADMTSPETKWYTPSVLEKGLSSYNQAMRDVCAAEGLNCVDAAAELPREAKYYYDDFHFSEAGAAKIGNLVAQTIRPLIKSCQSK